MKTSLIVVLVHGLLGNAADWTAIHNKLISSDSNNDFRIFVLCSRRNHLHTHRGVEYLGRNLVVELRAFLKKSDITASDDERVYITFVGHSLGGLISEQAIDLLYCGDDPEFRWLRPCSFITISTPHLGTWRTVDNVGVWTLSEHKLVNFACRNLLGRTGRELQMKDHRARAQPPADGPPLEPVLMRLSKSMAMHQFHHRAIIGHHLDQTVPLSSALLLGPAYLSKRTSASGADVFRIGFHEGFPRVGSPDAHYYVQLNLPEVQQYARESPVTATADGQDVVLSDGHNTIRYRPELLASRDKGWRRASIDFMCPGVWKYLAHELVIGKVHWFEPRYLRKSADESAAWIARLILADFQAQVGSAAMQ